MAEEKSEVEKLQDAILAQADDVKQKDIIRKEAKKMVKKSEEDLRQVKHLSYRAEKKWVEARKKLKTLIRRKWGLGSASRSWCKKNLGIVLGKLMGG